MAGRLNFLDLEPCLYRHAIEPAPDYIGRQLGDGTTQWGGFPHSVFHPVKKLAEADRVKFLCPKCFQENGGAKGTHSIRIDLLGRGTPDEACNRNRKGEPVRWGFSGKRLADLTLRPSILIEGGCRWHGFVEGGKVRTV